MAQILLVDPDVTARTALQGILDRGSHRLAAVASVDEAWTFIHTHPGVDLIFLELRLRGESGLRLVERLRADPLLKSVPVVIYTDQTDRTAVRPCLDLHVQNFLVKPYGDEAVFAEVTKAIANSWRAQLFEEEKSFCHLMSCTPAELHQHLRSVHASTLAVQPVLERWGKILLPTLPRAARELAEDAEAAGAWGVVEVVTDLQALAEAGEWKRLPAVIANFALVAELIRIRLEPDRAAIGFERLPESEAAASDEHLDFWLNAPAEERAPVVPWEDLLRQIDELPGCPIIDTAAAAFRMAANGHPSCINPLMDLVARDPGLSAQMLIAANRARGAGSDPFACIEDARLAVGQLGERRLALEAGKLITVDQQIMQLGPQFNWPQFWIFQRAVARVAQQICHHLELYSMESTVRTAGELHDIGKLLLARVQPVGFHAILAYSAREAVTLRVAEERLLGGTTMQLAAHFADRIGLSDRFANVMRWLNEPTAATRDERLVAVVALARELCQDFHVGTSGEPARQQMRPIQETPAWAVLRDCVYPSFNLTEFEQQIHGICRKLRTEFTGQAA